MKQIFRIMIGIDMIKEECQVHIWQAQKIYLFLECWISVTMVVNLLSPFMNFILVITLKFLRINIYNLLIQLILQILQILRFHQIHQIQQIQQLLNFNVQIYHIIWKHAIVLLILKECYAKNLMILIVIYQNLIKNL